MEKKQIRVGDFKIGDLEKKEINEVLDNGKLSEGRKVSEFEKLFAKYIGTRFAIAVSSGTAALIAGITAMVNDEPLGVKPGTKVITTPLTYIATSNAIVNTDFIPRYVDVDIDTFGITPENIRQYLEENGSEDHSFVLPVHLMGYACDMDGINRLANKYGLLVFEDSSQAHGTMYNGKKLGSYGLLSAFSFYIAHNIQAGEMGAITTDDYDIVKLVRKIKANGRVCDCPVCTRAEGKCPRLAAYEGEDDLDPRFTHDLIGYNFKTMEFQAALGVTQLRRADWIKEKRYENVKYLNEGLESVSDALKLPVLDKNVSYLAYPLAIRNPASMSRMKLRKMLGDRGVESRPLFGSIPTQQPAYKHLKEEYHGKLPNADYLGKNAFYVGCHQYLEQDELDYMVKSIKAIVKEM